MADAIQEFFTDWLIRRNYREAEAFFAPEVYACIADSAGLNPKSSAERLRQAGLQVLENAAEKWGRPHDLGEVMTPVLPWSPAVRIVKHAFEQNSPSWSRPQNSVLRYECGATPPPRASCPPRRPCMVTITARFFR